MNYDTLLPGVKQAAFDSCRCLESGNLAVSSKGPNDFLTSVDLAVSAALCRELPRLLPGSLVVSEEGPQAESGTENFLRWIIDPIDGTNNLIYGLPFYAVSIGLVQEEGNILGAVYHPATGELFSAARNCGAFVENVLIPGRGPRPIRVDNAASLDRAIVMAETDPYDNREQNPSPEMIKTVFQRCIDCRITGAAAVDMSYIAAGRAHVHFCRHLNPWDYAGGAAILAEAGGILTQWDGKPMTYRGKHSSLAASNRAIHEEMLEIAGRFL